MKIMGLNDYSYIEGGAGSVAIKSAVGLVKQGHEVVFFSAAGPICEELLKSPFKKVICLGQKDILNNPNKLDAALSGIYNWRAIKEIKKLFNNWLPDIVHIHSVSKALSWAVVNTIYSYKIPIIYTLHDYGLLCPNMGIYNYQTDKLCSLYQSGCGVKCLMINCDKRNYIYKVWRWIRYYFSQQDIGVKRKISGYIAVSNFTAGLFKKYLPQNKPVRVIYNPIDMPSFNNSIKMQRAFKKATFLYLGRLSPEKGVDLLLEAMKRVDANLIIIGDGEKMNKGEALSKELGEEKIKILDWQNSKIISEAMRKCVALVVPSKCMETAGLVVMEAAANSLPCIVANQGGLIEFVKHEVNGLYFEANNVSSLEQVMNKIINTSHLAESLGKKSKEMLKNYKMDIDSHINELEKFYIEVVNKCGE